LGWKASILQAIEQIRDKDAYGRQNPEAIKKLRSITTIDASKTSNKNTNKMNTKTAKNGRISVKNRQALKAPVSAFAKASNLNTNLVMSAVLWCGERTGARMSLKALTALITAETIATYRQELARRAAYFNGQVQGMVRRSLPKALRNPATITQVSAKIVQSAAGFSLPALKDLIATEVAAMSAAAEA